MSTGEMTHSRLTASMKNNPPRVKNGSLIGVTARMQRYSRSGSRGRQRAQDWQ